MDRLWSTWRSKYMDSFNTESDEKKCIFCNCQLLDVNDNSNLLVFKDKLTFVVLNLYPYNGGHLMIVPYRHTDDFNSLSKDENLGIMKNLQLAQNVLSRVMKPQGFNIGANLGRAAGAGIDQHIHFHIVPRWIGDINFMPALGEVKVISQDLLELKKRLIEEFNSSAQK